MLLPHLMFWHVNELTRGIVYKHKNLFPHPSLALFTVPGCRHRPLGIPLSLPGGPLPCAALATPFSSFGLSFTGLVFGALLPFFPPAQVCVQIPI